MRLTELENEITISYHGSPVEFDKFNTPEVFMAKDYKEALRYGKFLYKIWFRGKPKFETNTIYVIDNDQIVKTERIQ